MEVHQLSSRSRRLVPAGAQWVSMLLMAAALANGGCIRTRGLHRGGLSPRAGIVELHCSHYDGEVLDGLVLVNGPIDVDARLIYDRSIMVDAIQDCATGEYFPTTAVDYRLGSPGPREVLRISEGFVYGRKIEIPLFPGSQGPPCVRVVLIAYDQNLGKLASSPTVVMLKKGAETTGFGCAGLGSTK